MKLAIRLPARALGVLGLIVALATSVPASGATTRGTATPAPRLAASYLVHFDNLTYKRTASGSLTGVSVAASGKVSGHMTVHRPLLGTGRLSGTLKKATVRFSVGKGVYTGTVDRATLQISGTYAYPGQRGVWKATPASKCEIDGSCGPAKCAKAYATPPNWNTERVSSPVPGMAGYIEPINVVISACSTVSLREAETALGGWKAVTARESITFHSFDIKCISPEKADVAGRGYVTQVTALRLAGCLGGNKLSLAGLENHVRIWKGAHPGAWFAAASYETACVSVNGKLRALADVRRITPAMRFFHCVDGGPGSFGSNGYNRAARDFASQVVAAARAWGWTVTEKKITRPVARGHGAGEDGVKFNGAVYVLTVKL